MSEFNHTVCKDIYAPLNFQVFTEFYGGRLRPFPTREKFYRFIMKCRGGNLQILEIFCRNHTKCRRERINLDSLNQQGTFWLKWPVASMVRLYIYPSFVYKKSRNRKKSSTFCASVKILQKSRGKIIERDWLFLNNEFSQKVAGKRSTTFCKKSATFLKREISRHKMSKLNAQTGLITKQNIADYNNSYRLLKGRHMFAWLSLLWRQKMWFPS
jgi:hypothetical protein